jgi:hypothetical protein
MTWRDSSTRERTPVVLKMLLRCPLTVRGRGRGTYS